MNLIKILKLLLVLAFGVSVYLTSIWGFGIGGFTVIGTSMFPNINHGDVCITYNKVFSYDLLLVQNDIIAFNANENAPLVKRVIGLPGDTIKISNGLVFVNRKLHDYPAILFERTDGILNITLRKDQYFVLGDNRANSRDSRAFGPINRRQIIGKVWIRWRSMTGH